MKPQSTFLGLLLLLNACHNLDNSDPSGTSEICQGIYLEKYTTFGMGAGGTSMIGNCLTDSLTFRVFVGIYDEGREGIDYQCRGDTLGVKYYSSNEQKSDVIVDVEGMYSIFQLKLLDNYSDKASFKFKDLEKLTTAKTINHAP